MKRLNAIHAGVFDLSGCELFEPFVIDGTVGGGGDFSQAHSGVDSLAKEQLRAFK